MMGRAIVEYMVNALWQFPLLAAGAWLLLRAANPGPRVQHGVWLAVLGVGVLLPAHGAASREPYPQLPMTVTYERTAGDRISLGHKPHLLTHKVLLSATATRWLARLYLATVILALLRIARSWILARRLVAHSRATFTQRTALAYYSQQFAVKTPQLRESADVMSPMIVGVKTPVLLLPEGFDRFPEDQVAAVFCHELAHIRRRDYLVNLFCQIAALPLAWHPVVSQVQERIRTTREMVCDAMAAQQIRSHVGYAKCLLALAHSMLAERDMTGPAQSLGLFSNNTLEERVKQLMDSTAMTMRTRVVRMASGVAMMVAALSLAAMLHVTPTLAQSAVDARPATAADSQAKFPAAAQPDVSPAPVKPAPTVPAARKKDPDKKIEQQVEEVEREVAKTRAMVDSQELRHRLEQAKQEASRAGAMADRPDIQQRLEETQKQIAQLSRDLASVKVNQRMEHAQQQMAQAMAMLDNPQFEREMEDMQRQMAKAAASLNSPGFQQRLNDLQEQLQKRMAEADRCRPSPSKP